MPRALHLLVLHACLAVAAIPMARAAGTLDTGFGYEGAVRVSFDAVISGDDRGVAVLAQADGKLILVGEVETENDIRAIGLARRLPNGNPDLAFGSNGERVLRDPDDWNIVPAAAVLQPDGGILVAATRFEIGPGMRPKSGAAAINPIEWVVLRVRPDGSGLDTAFGLNGMAWVALGAPTAMAAAIALQPDGRILTAGTVDGLSSVAQMAVSRLMPSGAVDLAFAGGDGLFAEDFAPTYGYAGARALLLQSDGRIVVGGQAQKSVGDGDWDMALIRLLADGSVDGGFGSMIVAGRVAIDFSTPGDVRDDDIRALAYRRPLLSDTGRKLVIGGSSDGAAVLRRPVLAMLTYAGALDTGFSGDGRLEVGVGFLDASETGTQALALERLSSLSLTTADHILFAGTVPTLVGTTCFARRIDFAGDPDPLFGNAGVLEFGVVPGSQDDCRAGTLADGRFLLAGASTIPMTMSGVDVSGFAVLAGDLLFRNGYE